MTGGVATYHVITDDGTSSASNELVSLEGRDLADLERRIEALEARGPLLRGSTDNRDLWDRVNALDERVASLEPGRRSAARTSAGTTEAGAPVADAMVDDVAVGEGEGTLSEAQQKEVKRLVDGAVRDRMAGRFADRTNRTLERLGIELTDDQRTKLDGVWSEHVTSIRETWMSVRDGAATREEAQEQMAVLNQAFTVTLAEFLPAGDAEAIGGALTTMGRGPGGGGGRGGGR